MAVVKLEDVIAFLKEQDEKDAKAHEAEMKEDYSLAAKQFYINLRSCRKMLYQDIITAVQNKFESKEQSTEETQK